MNSNDNVKKPTSSHSLIKTLGLLSTICIAIAWGTSNMPTSFFYKKRQSTFLKTIERLHYNYLDHINFWMTEGPQVQLHLQSNNLLPTKTDICLIFNRQIPNIPLYKKGFDCHINSHTTIWQFYKIQKKIIELKPWFSKGVTSLFSISRLFKFKNNASEFQKIC